MRTLIKCSIPVEAGNNGITNGTLERVINEYLETVRPEAAYFGLEDGCRTMFSVVNVDDSSSLPRLFEPFFMELNASIVCTPIMNAADLKNGLGQLKSKKR